MASNASAPGFNQFDIDVHFDPSSVPVITLSGVGFKDEKVSVPQGIAVVSFHLINALGNQPLGRFPSAPIQWVNADRTPAGHPQALSVLRMHDSNVVIQVTNTVLDEHAFPFFIVVQQDRLFFAHDPTIINLPPTGGGQRRKPKPKEP